MGHALVYLPALDVVLSDYVLLGAAVAHAISQVFVLMGSLYFMRRLLSVTFGEFMRATWRALTACLLMIAAVLALRFNPPVQGEGAIVDAVLLACSVRSEEHTSELQSLMRISYAVFCLKK